MKRASQARVEIVVRHEAGEQAGVRRIVWGRQGKLPVVRQEEIQEKQKSSGKKQQIRR